MKTGLRPLSHLPPLFHLWSPALLSSELAMQLTYRKTGCMADRQATYIWAPPCSRTAIVSRSD